MLDTLISKMRLYDTVSDEEECALLATVGEQRDFQRGQLIVRADTELTQSNLVAAGMAHRFKDMANGQRQSMEVGIAGDFLDLHGLLMKRIDHDVAALTDCTIVFFPHDRLVSLTVNQPHLTRLLWLLTIIDAAIHRQWILSLGVRNAQQRTAHFFCEMVTRLQAVGRAERHRCELPLTQQQLSEILGMTQVHVNRTLRWLREQGLATLSGRTLEITDWDRLKRLAEFNPAYLGMEQRPR